MLYDNDKLEGREKSTKSWMDVGIKENCKLDRVESKQTDKGNKFIAFYFVNEAGEEVSKTEWEPFEGKNKEQKAENQLQRIKHIITTYIPEENFDIKASSFEDMAEKVKEILGNSYKDVKVRLKVVYDSKGYTTLPSYTFNKNKGKYAFIEKMSDEQQMEITSYDALERPKPDKEIPANNPLYNNNNPTNDEKSDDLPF